MRSAQLLLSNGRQQPEALQEKIFRTTSKGLTMDYEKALLNPAKEFVSPRDVIAEQSLTQDQKIQVLRRWEYDALELEVAEEENMGGDSSSILSEVLDALHSLNAKVDTEHTPPTKQGGE